VQCQRNDLRSSSHTSKCNEIKAVEQLLNLLEIEGSIITLGAMGCQREIARQIIEKKADYILAVKLNQAKLYQEIAGLFTHQKTTSLNAHTTGDHGRIEQRSCSVIQQLLKRVIISPVYNTM
jgi:predicted transposase YbfD/YdcC